MIKEYIEKIIEKENLSFDESYKAMQQIMSGEVSDVHLTAFLVALKSKEETSEEIAGFVKAMKETSIKIICDDKNVIDVCGTGGDNSGSFNISTAVSFAAAGAGVKVAKHGNRSISSKSGSADVLQELGIDINLSRDESEAALNEIGITFLFAPNYHPAMKFAAPVRKALGIKTVFNMLGPLTNPANVKKQIVGTFNIKAAQTMSGAAKFLELEKVCFICCCNKYDEVYLGDDTDIFEHNHSQDVKNYTINHETFGYPKTNSEEIKGDTSATNAKIILDVFSQNGAGKNKNGAFHTIAANTALALYCAGFSNDLKECSAAAEESIISGAALNKINELKNFRKS